MAGTVHDIVFLLDCDDTLLDNDRVQADLGERIEMMFGAEGRTRYWQEFEHLREQLGYVDYLGALQRCRDPHSGDPRLLQLANYLLDYPFAERLYPQALQTLTHLRRWGPTVVLSDGDVVFQPHKLERSGLWQAVDGRVLVYIHKELMLDDVERRYPARHYVMVDDKPYLLEAIKRHWGARVTTVLPLQGHYAHDPRYASCRAPDLPLPDIGALLQLDLATLRAVAALGQPHITRSISS